MFANCGVVSLTCKLFYNVVTAEFVSLTCKFFLQCCYRRVRVLISLVRACIWCTFVHLGSEVFFGPVTFEITLEAYYGGLL